MVTLHNVLYCWYCCVENLCYKHIKHQYSYSDFKNTHLLPKNVISNFIINTFIVTDQYKEYIQYLFYTDVLRNWRLLRTITNINIYKSSSKNLKKVFKQKCILLCIHSINMAFWILTLTYFHNFRFTLNEQSYRGKN